MVRILKGKLSYQRSKVLRGTIFLCTSVFLQGKATVQRESLKKLFTVANLHYQLSWQNQLSGYTLCRPSTTVSLETYLLYFCWSLELIGLNITFTDHLCSPFSSFVFLSRTSFIKPSLLIPFSISIFVKTFLFTWTSLESLYF